MSERKGQTKAGLETNLLPAINCIKENLLDLSIGKIRRLDSRNMTMD
jgi:hypothetical protein